MANTNLVIELKQSLTELRNKLGSQGEKICEKELTEIKDNLDELHKINQQQTAFPAGIKEEVRLLGDLVTRLEEIIAQIDKEVELLEVEMHGVQNYSDYENHQIQDQAYKKDFKDALQEIIDRIRVDLPYI
jgi:predicted nuclease with TOPRIM domain